MTKRQKETYRGTWKMAFFTIGIIILFFIVAIITIQFVDNGFKF